MHLSWEQLQEAVLYPDVLQLQSISRGMSGGTDGASVVLVQLSNGIFLLKRVSRYGRFMIDSGSKGCPEQESAGCHFGTLGRNFLRAKTKWPPNISRSNMIFQQMKPGASVIPHFHVILTGQSISCIILMTQGHLQGQKDNFKVKKAKIQFLPNKDRNMCNTSFTWDFI